MTALREQAKMDFDPLDLPRLRQWSDEHHPEHRKTPDYKLLDKLGGEYVEPLLQNPTFLTDMPLVISPLVKTHRERDGLAERADLYVAGFELAPIYSELNDALDQRARFEAQTARRDAGDDEAHEQDEDFLLALEYGMPPTAGMGMGIDRLTMILADRDSIRDVLLFPLLRPKRATPKPPRPKPERPSRPDPEGRAGENAPCPAPPGARHAHVWTPATVKGRTPVVTLNPGGQVPRIFFLSTPTHGDLQCGQGPRPQRNSERPLEGL